MRISVKNQTIVEIADYFEVSVDYLLGLSSVSNPYSADRFSPKEAEIIAKYRKLSTENKIRIDERLEAMIDGQKQIKFFSRIMTKWAEE